MRQRLQTKSDWTVRALSTELKSAGINVSHDTVWRFLRSEEGVVLVTREMLTALQ